MKQVLYILTLILALLSCKGQTEKMVDNSTVPSKIKLHKLKKLFVVGDFDGDKKQDMIFQHNYSRSTKTEIEYSADPFQNRVDAT